ncbi:MAG: hypothetical protein BYD32DRAFT_66841, partial [Podila humilis]
LFVLLLCVLLLLPIKYLSIYIANTIGDTNIARTRTPAHRTASRPLAFDPAAAFLVFFLSLGSLAGASWGHEVTEHWKAVMLAGRGTGPDPPTEIESWSTQRKVRLLARPSLTQRLSFGYRMQEVVLPGWNDSWQTQVMVLVGCGAGATLIVDD